MQYVKDPEKQQEEMQAQQEEQKRREEWLQAEKKKKTRRKKIIIGASIAIVLIIVALVANSFLSPGKYDEFAQCLTEKGAKMYGEDWCKYTQGQKNMFGKSFEYINYEVKKNLVKRPTWIIGGQKYEGVQSFETLAALTGCKWDAGIGDADIEANSVN